MNTTTVAIVLTAILGGGGITGLVAFFRVRADNNSTVVDTVSKGLVVMERINDRLEEDLANEHRARIEAETELEQVRAELFRLRRIFEGDATHG